MLESSCLLLLCAGLATAQAACYGVFCTQELAAEDECSKPDTTGPCSTLEFYDTAGQKLTSLQLTRDDDSDLFEARRLGRGVKKVASVRQIGPGCHRVFKGGRFKGEELTLKGSNMIDLAEKGYGATVIKSVKYDVNCQFPSKAGVGWTVPVLAISLVINLALVMVLVVMFKRKREADQTEP